jgi:hypothetical protein
MHTWAVDLHVAVYRAMNVNVMSRLDHNVKRVTTNAAWAGYWKFFSTLRASVFVVIRKKFIFVVVFVLHT